MLTKAQGGNRKARLAMEFAQEQAGDVVIVRIAGPPRQQHRAARRGQLLAGAGSGAPRLAIDLSKLEYISSAGLRVLLVVAKKVQQAKGKVVLFGLGAECPRGVLDQRFRQDFRDRARCGVRRRGGAVRAAAMLGFVEEIVLLQLDDTHGSFVDLPLSAADVVLAGAALMELALHNRIDTDLEQLIVVDPTPTGDEILDDVLVQLGRPATGLSAAAAIERITLNAGNIRNRR